jgi:hypothetical protein
MSKDAYLEMMLNDIDEDDIYTKDASEIEYEYDNVGQPGSDNSDLDFEEDISEYGYANDEEESSVPATAQRIAQPTSDKTERQNQMAVGMMVELEHIHWWEGVADNLELEEIAQRIAEDHLKQRPDYYHVLIRSGLVDEKEALDLYRSLYGEIQPIVADKKAPPLPKSRPANTPKATEYQSDFKMTIEPITEKKSSVPAAQPVVEESVPGEYIGDIGDFKMDDAEIDIVIDDSGW